MKFINNPLEAIEVLKKEFKIRYLIKPEFSHKF